MNQLKKYLKVFIGIYLSLLVVAVIFQRQIMLHPQLLSHSFKYNFTGKIDEFFLSPEQNIELNLLYFHTNQPPKGIVFYLHGNSDNLVRWGKHAHEFTNRGYDVLMYDYRGFGKSTGSTTEENLLKDAQFLYKDIILRFPENEIIVYGRSLGTGIATKIAADNSPKYLILETPYYSLADLSWSYLPIFPYSYIANFQLPTCDWIPKVHCPIHIFHGTADEIVQYSQSLKLVNLLKTPKILTTLPEGHHRGLEKFSAYQQKMDELLR